MSTSAESTSTTSTTSSTGTAAPTLAPEEDLSNAVKSLMRVREELAKLSIAT
jgi:hypothetical protein